MTEENKPLLILSIVAIVAIVGIVLGLFGMSKTKVISPVGTAEEDLVGEAYVEIDESELDESDLVGEAFKKAKSYTNQSNQIGNLYVASYPTKSDLYVDEIYKGKTPITVKGLCTGKHNVLVKNTNPKYCGAQVCQVSISPGKTTKIFVRLTKSGKEGTCPPIKPCQTPYCSI